MAEDPIRVSSTAWTGLPAEPVEAPPVASPKPPPSPGAVIASAIALIVLGFVGVWQAAVTGQVRCRGCSTISATDDPVQYGLYVMLFMWCVPAGLAVLVLGVRDARRKRRATGSPPARSGSSDGSGRLV